MPSSSHNNERHNNRHVNILTWARRACANIRTYWIAWCCHSCACKHCQLCFIWKLSIIWRLVMITKLQINWSWLIYSYKRALYDHAQNWQKTRSSSIVSPGNQYTPDTMTEQDETFGAEFCSWKLIAAHLGYLYHCGEWPISGCYRSTEIYHTTLLLMEADRRQILIAITPQHQKLTLMQINPCLD